MAYDIPSYGTSGYKNPLGKDTPSWGGGSSGNSYDNLPGYKNPLGNDTPSWGGGKIDWEGEGGGINWKEPSWGVQKEREQPSWFDKASKALEKSTAFKQQRENEDNARFGSATGGSAGQVLENLGVIFPQQHAPVFIPGQQSKGKGGTIGSIAGMIGGAILGGPAGFAAGATLGGQLGGATGSLFD